MQIFVYSVALKWNLHELVFITHGEIIGGHETKDQRNRDKEASGQHFFLKEIAIIFSKVFLKLELVTRNRSSSLSDVI